MFNGSNYSLSDIAAVTGCGTNNGSGGFGNWGGDGWWIILLFLLWGNNGWGNGGRGGGSIREEISYGFDMNGLESGVRGVQQGLADGFYAMNTVMLNGFNSIQNTLCQGFSGVNAATAQQTFDLSTQLHGIAAAQADCCCQTQRAIERGFADTNYNLATQACDTRRAIADSTRDIIDSNNAGVRSILDFLTQDKIATLTAENQSLKFAASQAAQNAFIAANQEAQTAELIRRLDTPCPVPAYVVPNPNCCYNYAATGYGYGNNCGCGCN